jgi:transcriptional regulator with XRE-family HTH domain
MFSVSIARFNHDRVSTVNTFVSRASKTIVIMDSIASRLAEARKKKGWTQEQLAKEAGVSQGTVGNIESGARRSLGSLPRLAEALGVPHNWLRDGGDATPTIDPNQTDPEAGKAVMRTAINVLATCLLDMDAESRKAAGHLLLEMTENPAGRWKDRLAELIEREAIPTLWGTIGIYDRAGNYHQSTQAQGTISGKELSSASREAVRKSLLPTGPEDAASGDDRDKDEGGSRRRASGAG